MPNGHGPKLSDEALDWLACRYFAEVRAGQADAPEKKARADTGDDGSLLDWLVGGDDGDGDGDSD